MCLLVFFCIVVASSHNMHTLGVSVIVSSVRVYSCLLFGSEIDMNRRDAANVTTQLKPRLKIGALLFHVSVFRRPWRSIVCLQAVSIRVYILLYRICPLGIHPQSNGISSTGSHRSCPLMGHVSKLQVGKLRCALLRFNYLFCLAVPFLVCKFFQKCKLYSYIKKYTSNRKYLPRPPPLANTHQGIPPPIRHGSEGHVGA